MDVFFLTRCRSALEYTVIYAATNQSPVVVVKENVFGRHHGRGASDSKKCVSSASHEELHTSRKSDFEGIRSNNPTTSFYALVLLVKQYVVVKLLIQ